MQTHYTLTSSAGHFVFPKETILGHAKLVRDTVTAGSRGTIPHTPIPTPTTAIHWLRDYMGGSISKTDFEWIAFEGRHVNQIFTMADGSKVVG
jgi:hypothetical protein